MKPLKEVKVKFLSYHEEWDRGVEKQRADIAKTAEQEDLRLKRRKERYQDRGMMEERTKKKSRTLDIK